LASSFGSGIVSSFSRGQTMPALYAKTPLGRSEIQSRTHALSRTARNLLLILDPSRSGEVWVSMVHGATPADLQALLEAGLVEEVPAFGAPSAAAQAAHVSAFTSGPVASADTEPFASTQADPDADPSVGRDAAQGAGFTSLSYSELNTRLNALVKAHLGLIKGYRFTLDIERAADVIELQRVALRLVAEVESAQGAAAAAEVRRALGL